MGDIYDLTHPALCTATRLPHSAASSTCDMHVGIKRKPQYNYAYDIIICIIDNLPAIVNPKTHNFDRHAITGRQEKRNYIII